MGNKLGYNAGELPVTESISDRLVRLPLFASISSDEVAAVIAQAQAFGG